MRTFFQGMSRLLHRSASLTVNLPIPFGCVGPDSGILPCTAHIRTVQARSSGGERDPRCRSPLDTDGNLPWSNRDISTYLTLFPTIVRSSPSVNRQTSTDQRAA